LGSDHKRGGHSFLVYKSCNILIYRYGVYGWLSKDTAFYVDFKIAFKFMHFFGTGYFCNNWQKGILRIYKAYKDTKGLLEDSCW
jgi:hypothetical protein